jgi:hypothetical protein
VLYVGVISIADVERCKISCASCTARKRNGARDLLDPIPQIRKSRQDIRGQPQSLSDCARNLLD